MIKLPKTSIEHWTALAAVVDAGGFAQAAAQLHRSQSAISYSVARLQQSLDVQLLAIEGRKAVLTPQGAALLGRVRPLLRGFDTLESLARSLKQGWEAELKLVVEAAFPQDQLLAILSELQFACPDTELMFSSAVLSGAEEAIIDGTADIVLTTRVPPGFLGDWLLDTRFIAAAHRDHPLHHLGRKLSADDLASHTQVVLRDSGVRNRRDEGWLGSNVRWTVTGMDHALGVMRAGLAFGWLPEYVIKASLTDGTLRPLPLAAAGTRKVPIYLVAVRPELAGPAVHTTIELFQRHVGPELARKQKPAEPRKRR
ncbi:MAG TPA: LysR family transcriptional regulator [Burkholderiaceae bacterium]|nr:LysR family transcriptional regulator [Burkholderiaceae bacterium]